MKKHFRLLVGMGILICFSMCKQNGLPSGDPDNDGLFLPDGFEAVVVADSVPGAVRHIAVNSNGDVYAKIRFPRGGGGNAVLRDMNGDGKADTIAIFGNYPDPGDYGTEMRIHNGYLWFSAIQHIYRQKLTPGKLIPDSPIELMVTDTQPPRQHDTKPVAFDKEGNMYIPFGAPSDCCQVMDRTPFSPGMNPCPILETRGGIWKFKADKPNQHQWDGERYATGLRSIVALTWDDQDNNLYTVMHGRDYLHSTWPQFYSEWEGAVLPSEEFFRVTKGMNGGWPYVYYDQITGKKMVSPEYGGNGKTISTDTAYADPIVGFPGHFAPNDLIFYTRDQFPDHYKNGAFVAFHGSTSSAPYAQSGYFIAFVPFRDGKPSGPWEVFADGFSGVDTVHNTSDAKYRPMGLSQGPDGSLYVSDSEKGKIWRIMFKGNKANFGEKSLAAMAKRKLENPSIKTPDPVKDDLDHVVYSEAGKTYNAFCGTCHGRDGKGSGRFPPLKGSEWLAGDVLQPLNIVLNGFDGQITVRGRTFINRMPGFAPVLTDKQIADILTYVKTEFNNSKTGVTVEEVAKGRKLLTKK